jgi:osmotically-inducible protein OsmY
MRFRTFVIAGLAAAAAAYLFDPVSGRSRRVRLRDRSMAIGRRTMTRAGKLSRHAGNVLQGKVHEIVNLAPERPMDDATVADRVRSEVLGRADVDAGNLLVDVAEGVVSLRGELDDPGRIERVIDLTGEIPGVRRVENLIHLPDAPAPNKAAILGDTWSG